MVGEKCGKEKGCGGENGDGWCPRLYIASTSTRRLSACPHLLPIGVYHSYPFENIGVHAFIQATSIVRSVKSQTTQALLRYPQRYVEAATPARLCGSANF